jgi:hypothetical protein
MACIIDENRIALFDVGVGFKGSNFGDDGSPRRLSVSEIPNMTLLDFQTIFQVLLHRICICNSTPQCSDLQTLVAVDADDESEKGR